MTNKNLVCGSWSNSFTCCRDGEWLVRLFLILESINQCSNWCSWYYNQPIIARKLWQRNICETRISNGFVTQSVFCELGLQCQKVDRYFQTCWLPVTLNLFWKTIASITECLSEDLSKKKQMSWSARTPSLVRRPNLAVGNCLRNFSEEIEKDFTHFSKEIDLFRSIFYTVLSCLLPSVMKIWIEPKQAESSRIFGTAQSKVAICVFFFVNDL